MERGHRTRLITRGAVCASARLHFGGRLRVLYLYRHMTATLAHELTHHVEGMANAHGLDDKDEEELLRLIEEYQKEP